MADKSIDIRISPLQKELMQKKIWEEFNTYSLTPKLHKLHSLLKLFGEKGVEPFKTHLDKFSYIQVETLEVLKQFGKAADVLEVLQKFFVNYLKNKAN